MTTGKQQELEALEKIEKIVESLGIDSYIGAAFAGAFDVARENIEFDAAFSLRERAASIARQDAIAEQSGKIQKLEVAIQKLEAQNAKLTAALEQEQEWDEYEDEENVLQSDYDRLARNSTTTVWDDDKAADFLADVFGFQKERIEILHSVPVYQINRHRQLRKVGTVERRPLYDASDWNYIRFDCGAMSYELYNGELHQFRH